MPDSKIRDDDQYGQLVFLYVVAYLVLFAGVVVGIVGRMPHDGVQDLRDALSTGAPATQHAIDRTSPMYWTTGNGAWAARWEGTNNDTWLAIVAIGSTLWLVTEYWRYANSCARVFHQLHSSVAKTHVLQLRRVFMQSMLIHACTGILVWWIPAFWVIAALTIAHAWQTRRLNTTKIQVLHANELAAAAATTAATLQVLGNAQLDVHERLDQATSLLMQRVSNGSN